MNLRSIAAASAMRLGAPPAGLGSADARTAKAAALEVYRKIEAEAQAELQRKSRQIEREMAGQPLAVRIRALREAHEAYTRVVDPAWDAYRAIRGSAVLGSADYAPGRTATGRFRHVRRLTAAQRDAAIDAFKASGLDGNGRFRSVGHGLNVAFSVLAQFGIEPDQVLSADLFRETSGSRPLRLAWTNPDDSFSPSPVEDMALAFSWHTERQWGADKPVEIVAYLS